MTSAVAALPLAAPTRRRLRPKAMLPAFLLPTLAGCGVLTEHSWPRPDDFHRLTPAEVQGNPHPPTARVWASAALAAYRRVYPRAPLTALTTEELVGPDGRPRDVFAHFGLRPFALDSLVHNRAGMLHTIQARSGDGPHSGETRPPPGFAPIYLSMDDGRRLDGLLGRPSPDADLGGSFVVAVPGLFGRLDSGEMRNICQALRSDGHHVLALNMRGHGDDPDGSRCGCILYGVQEARDLLTVDRRLRADLGARRVGLLAFSLAANHGLLAAWVDGRAAEPEDADSPVFASLPAAGAAPAFDAGMLLVSPAVNLVSVGAWMEHPLSVWTDPVKAHLQRRAARRRIEGAAPDGTRMWRLFEQEFGRSDWSGRYPDFPSFRIDAERFFDLRGTFTEGPDRGRRRLERVRVPVLVLHAADDPVGSAQAAAEIFVGVSNPNCAAILFAQGGHSGFNPLFSPVFYGLLAGFFDPRTAPAAAR
jgi:predicted alpha/beta-fold hydrolase